MSCAGVLESSSDSANAQCTLRLYSIHNARLLTLSDSSDCMTSQSFKPLKLRRSCRLRLTRSTCSQDSTHNRKTHWMKLSQKTHKVQATMILSQAGDVVPVKYFGVQKIYKQKGVLDGLNWHAHVKRQATRNGTQKQVIAIIFVLEGSDLPLPLLPLPLNLVLFTYLHFFANIHLSKNQIFITCQWHLSST